MAVLKNLIQILLIGIGIFIWNKYVIPNFIKKVVKLNSGNEWLAKNKNIITKGFQGFYWGAYGMFIIAIIYSYFK